MPPPDEALDPLPNGGARPRAPALVLVRMLATVSRTRWFSFLRRVYRYQNVARPEPGSSPLDSPGWLALELIVLLAQMLAIVLVLAESRHEAPAWPLRLWIAAYNVGKLLSLPLLYWRHRKALAYSRASGDAEMQVGTSDGAGDEALNRARSSLELFFAAWFVMGNVWLFDPRMELADGAPRLHALCVALLLWNAAGYALPFLLFLLLCCVVPLVGYTLGYNMNAASAHRGASDEELSALPHWPFKSSHSDLQAPSNTALHTSECCICLSAYREKEEVRRLPCGHLFHRRCVDRWMRIVFSCPLCKHHIASG